MAVYTHTNWEQFLQAWKGREGRGGENILNTTKSALVWEPHNEHPFRLNTYMLIIL